MSAVRFRLTFGAFRRIILYKKKTLFLSVLFALSVGLMSTRYVQRDKKASNGGKNDLQTEICA